MASCPTCVGLLESPRNLCDPLYRNLLDLLQKLLDLKVQVKDEAFLVCSKCMEKLIWISEFQDSCRKCYIKICTAISKSNEQFTQPNIVELSKETISDYEDFSYEPQEDDSDSYFNPDNVNINKNEMVQHGQNTEKPKYDKEFEIITIRKTRTRKPLNQQFPKEEVLKAVAECTNYLTDVKYKSCLHCSYEASITRVLRMHMKAKHEKSFKTWCSRCNVQTDNLRAHEEATNCFDNRCKFCNKNFGDVTKLTAHLRSHCPLISISKEPTENEEYPDVLSIEKITSKKCKLKSSVQNRPQKEKQAECHEIEHIELNHNVIKEEPVFIDNEQCSAMQSESTDKSLNSTLQLFDHKEVVQAISAIRRRFHVKRKCVVCGFLSSNTSGLSNHMTGVHMDVRHKWCRICNALVNDLTNHSISHRKDLLKCTFCDRSYNSIPQLNYHLKHHSRLCNSGEQAKWFSCSICLSFYPDEQQLKNHKCTGNIEYPDENTEQVSKISTVRKSRSDASGVSNKRLKMSNVKSKVELFPHEEVQKAMDDTMKIFRNNKKCVICAMEMINARALGLHISKKHNDVKDTWCNMCNTMVDNLRTHKQGHKSDLLKCAFCNLGFNRQNHLKRHLECHSRLLFENRGKWYDCDVCPNTYPDEQQLKDHECHGPDPDHNGKKIKIMSTGSTKKPCTVCGKRFLTDHSLGVHMYIHTGKTFYKCSHCGKYLRSKTNLTMHERSHSGEKSYICNVCGKGFTLNGSLETHMKIHTGRPEECTICQKRFCRPVDLERHMHRHTGEKSYLCSICGMSFYQKCNLIDHLRRHHSNKRPFKCRFCEKAFKVPSIRKNHEDIHRGIKPYKCSVCPYSCLRSYRLTMHMRQHSADAPQPHRPHKCLLCHKQFSTQAMLTSHTNHRHGEIV